MKIEIYTMRGCPYCVKAKEILSKRLVPFVEHVLTYEDDAAWEQLEERTGMSTVPQIFAGEKFIGGCEDLEDLDKEDQLKSLKI